MNFKLFKKPETEDQLIERWSNILILHANYKGQVDRKSFILDYVFEDLPSVEEQIKWLNHPARKIRDEVMKKSIVTEKGFTTMTAVLVKELELVKSFLLNNDYIEEPNITESFWRLSTKGKLARELGGHKKYVRYRKREINALAHQRFINWWLIVGTILAALMPWVVAGTCNQKIVVNPAPVQVIRQDIPIDTGLLRQLVSDELQKKQSNPQLKPTIKTQPPK